MLHNIGFVLLIILFGVPAFYGMIYVVSETIEYFGQ